MKWMTHLRATTAIVLAGMLATGGAYAQTAKSAGAKSAATDYPSRPLRLVVSFPPGASNDIVARLIGQRLTDAWQQQIVVDNRPGAGGLIGGETVANATPDGYTLLLANPGPNVNSVLLRRKPPYHLRDFAPVIFLGYTPLIIVANLAFPPRTAREVVEYAKANPGKMSWGSSGIGSISHIGLALFQAATGVNVVHVPYKGGAQAFLDIISGRVPLMHTTAATGEVHIKAGRIRLLGVAGSKRLAVLPDVPTLAEQGIKSAEALVWFGIVAPARTPRAIVGKLNAEANKVLALPDVRTRFGQLGLEIAGGTPEEFGAFMDREAARLRKLIQAGLIQQE